VRFVGDIAGHRDRFAAGRANPAGRFFSIAVFTQSLTRIAMATSE
jgi:hypothetical protein